MSLRRLIALAAVALVAAPAVASAASERCAVAATAHPPLPRVARLVTEGQPLRIVAIGSSSTEGTGATSPDRTYPAQLRAILATGRPAVAAEIVNSGIGGETVGMNMARLERDVLAHRPDLVIWQITTNDVFRNVPQATYAAEAREGIRRLRDSGADVILMEPQYLAAKAGDGAFLAAVATVRDLGAEFGLPVVARFDFMKEWLDDGRFTPADLLSADGLHMTDASYRCLAEVVADIVAPPAVATASGG